MSAGASSFPRTSAGVLPLALALLAAAAVARLAPDYWSRELVEDAAGWTSATFAIAALLRVALRERAAAALVAIAALYFAYGAGLNEVAAVALLLVSSRALGAGVLASAGASPARELEFSRPFVVGLTFFVGIFGVLIHGSANTRGLYFAVLMAPLAVGVILPGGRKSFGATREALAEASAALARLPFWRLVAVVAIVGFVARFAFFPTVGADDNFLHLRLWTELTFQSRAAFAVDDEVWAVAPFAFDLIHAVVSLVAASDARSALDLAVLALLLRQIWAVSAIFKISDGERLFALALFASTPLVAGLLTSLQVELFLAWLALVGVRLLVDRAKAFDIGDFLALGAVAALCAATKLPAVALGGTLFAVGVARALTASDPAERRPEFRRWPCVLAAFLAFAFVALHAYALAWRITGNPVFPLLNGFFCSRYLDCTNFSDRRWAHGFGLRPYVGLFFDTHDHQESKDYTAGFQYLFLLPFGVVLAGRRLKSWDAAAVLAPLLIFGVAMFSQTSYLRYLFPVAGIASVAIAALPGRGPRPARRAVAFGVWACIALNLYFLPGISWMFADSPQRVYTPAGRARANAEFSTGRALTLEINRLGQGYRVLYPTGNLTGATLLGEPLYVHRYAYGRMNRYRAMKDDKDVAAFLRDERVDLVLTSPDAEDVAQDLLVADYIARNGEPVLSLDRFSVLKVRDTPVAYRRLFDLATPLQLGGTPKLMARVQTGGATEGRYTLRYVCPSASGYVFAQVNWDRGPPYFKPTPCRRHERTFIDAFTIPIGATTGDIYVSTYFADGVNVTGAGLEAN